MTSIRKDLAYYLQRCNILEIMTQKIREKIAENPYFQIQTVFERMDKFKKGYLVPDDISQFMLQNKIYPTQTQLYLIFRQIDKERVGVITVDKLADELLPKQNPKLSKQATDRKYYACGFRLSIDLQYLVSRYFEHKIKEFIELASIRLQMNNKTVFIVQDAFKLLDSQGKGLINSLNQIDSFLRSNGKVLQRDQLSRVYRYLSFDRQHILYECFSEQFDPLGKGFYIAYSEKIAEKIERQNGYLERRRVLNQIAYQKQQQKEIHKRNLQNIQISNSRLQRIIEEQELQLNIQNEQVARFRQRKYNI